LKKNVRAWIFFTIFATVAVVALISWFAFDWRERTNGLIEMLGVVIPSVLAVAASLVSIWKDTKKDKSGTTQQTGDGLQVAGDITNLGTLVGQQTINNYPPPVLRKDEPEKLPRLPARGKLPEVGALPPGSHVPYPRNACFTGREADLLALADALLYPVETGRVTVMQMLAATGLGGMGKTQLAVEFCHRYGRYFEGVHWLNCRDGKLESEIATCGLHMGLQPWPEKQPEQVEMTLRIWQASRRRLIVLDNLEDPEVLRAWMPRLDRCRLLITARRPDWPADLGLQTQPLGLFSPVESRDLLRRLALRLKTVADVELDGITEKLGRLPLALDLAGRYLNDRETLNPTAYLQVLAEQENLLQHSSLLSWVEGGSPTGHETSLAATFQLSWLRLAGEVPANALARKVFLLAGWCAPNIAIPRELLSRACAVPEEDFDRALKRLAGLGLVELLANGSVLHPLLAAFAQSLQAEDEKNAYLSTLTKALAKLSSEADDTGLPQAFELLRPHLEYLAPVAEQAGIVEVSELWNYLGLYLQMIADLAGAKFCFERATRINEAAYGAKHPETAWDVNSLGSVLMEQGDLAGAKDCFERALRIYEAAFGAEHPEIASVLNNLGGVLQEQGDLTGAKACYERALRIDEATYGAEHYEVATIFNNLGVLSKEQDDLAGAKGFFERALRIKEATFGAEHPEVAVVVNNLGLVLEEQGDRVGAKQCYERALRILEKFLPPEHPKIQLVRSNLES